MLSPRFDRALAYASDAHRAQVRKGSGIPYVSHLLGVCALALEMGADEDQAIAALLHDAVEDQGGEERLSDIRANFGDRVAAMVADCTDGDLSLDDRGPWRARKEAYVASLATKAEASLLVSLADKTHNAGCIVADLSQQGEAIWDRFSADRDGVIWYYGALCDAFAARMADTKTQRLRELVVRMASS